MLRPIDVTITIQNSGDAGRVGQTNAARPEIAAQMFADRLEKQVKQQEQQVAKTQNADNPDVDPDRQGHGGGYKPKHKRTKPEEKPKPKPKATGESLYDIMI
ncbi:MAG: hypothetical protein FWG87_09490 [Defluviitaleaceae bacterium]|nr:hypothetical protein [Defluviitaleaceae bacterium]